MTSHPQNRPNFVHYTLNRLMISAPIKKARCGEKCGLGCTARFGTHCDSRIRRSAPPTHSATAAFPRGE